MSDAPTNVINMQARARLIREAQEAREKRKNENGAKAQAALIATIEADLAAEKPAFPGGIDDMEI